MAVFVVGALHWDVVVRASRLPREDETLNGTSVAYQFGGKGGNQAIAAARAGAKVAMAGRIGADQAGREMLSTLERHGVDIEQVQRGSGASGMSAAIINEAGAYQAVIVSAENANMDPAEISIPQDTKVVVLQNETPVAVNERVARAAQARNIQVVHNAAPARAPLSFVDTLVVNRVEAADLLRVPLDELDPEHAVETLCASGVPFVIITLGGDGVIFNSDGAIHRHPAHEVPVVSTHGAGDAFVGTLAAQFALGQDRMAAIAIAQRAAALHVSGQTGSL